MSVPLFWLLLEQIVPKAKILVDKIPRGGIINTDGESV